MYGMFLMYLRTASNVLWRTSRGFRKSHRARSLSVWVGELMRAHTVNLTGTDTRPLPPDAPPAFNRQKSWTLLRRQYWQTWLEYLKIEATQSGEKLASVRDILRVCPGDSWHEPTIKRTLALPRGSRGGLLESSARFPDKWAVLLTEKPYGKL